MPEPRKRRIVRRTLITAAVAVLLIGLGVTWLSSHESKAIHRSRMVNTGMTRSEVESILGQPVATLTTSNQTTLLYGKSAVPLLLALLQTVANQWFEIDVIGDAFNADEWPVSVWMDDDGRVTRVVRTGELDAPLPTQSP